MSQNPSIDLEALRYLVANFEPWSAHCAKILTKRGQIQPLVWNAAQRFIHDKLEEQRRTKGYVRALILKGRQQGCCYSPEMRVLTADYRWVRIGDLQPGDRLWAVDEDIGVETTASGRASERRARVAVVEATVSFRHQAYAVRLSNGVRLEVTGEHRHLCLQRGGCLAQWRTVEDLKVGDLIRAFAAAPGEEPGMEDAWFGGLLDGEGSFGASPQVRIALSQVDGPVLQRAKRYLESRGIRFYELIDRRTSGVKSKLGDKPVHCLRVDRTSDILRLLTLTRPTRFVDRALFEGKKLPKSCEGFDAWPKVLEITPLGEIDVVDIQTSEKTFICEGLVSHNSTYVAARFYHKTSTTPGEHAFIVSHEDKSTANLFKMVKRYHDYNQIKPSTKHSNAQELVFGELDAGYKVATAGSKDVGRSNTVRLLHGSEFAFWDNAQTHLAGIGNTIPSGADAVGTEIILESTANGLGNAFHLMWQAATKGEGEYIPIFVPWFWQPEYRATLTEGFMDSLSDEDLEYMQTYSLDFEQMQWRANKIAEYGAGYEWLFDQEYPATPALAFRVPTGKPLIGPSKVMAAVNSTYERFDMNEPLIIGVDPASDGEDPSAQRDRTAIAFRRGRLCYRVEYHQDLDEMQVVSIVAEHIRNEQPDAVFIDKGGIGSGIVSRLRELNFDQVRGVLFGQSAQEDELYINKRAEIWWRMKDWFNDQPCRVPDDASLVADVSAPQPKHRSDKRKQLESKEDMAKRQIRSPDGGDALALTFTDKVSLRAQQLASMATGRQSAPASKSGY